MSYFFSQNPSTENAVPAPDVPLTYEIIEGASNKGGAKLVDSYGHHYTKKKTSKDGKTVT